MIITGIFMFLLGTKLGQAASRTEVKYEGPNKVTMIEQRDENIILPGLGSPPFAPSFLHQGSNFFFNPQIVLPGGIIPTEIDSVITPIQPINEIIVTPEVKSEIIIKNEPVVEVIEVNRPIPQVQVEIESMPIGIPISPELPCAEVEITNVFPGAPMLVEEPQPSSGLFISEVEVLVNEIPPPPELPPLVLTEIPRPVVEIPRPIVEIPRPFVEIPRPVVEIPRPIVEIPRPVLEIPKPVIVQDKNILLIPSAPELASFYPQPIMVAENLPIPDCVQNIVMERFLPNVAFGHGQIVEMISVPAAQRAPVVSSIMY